MPTPAVDQYAEQAVLGALLLYGESRHVAGVAGRGLRSEHFFYERYGAVYTAALSLAERQAKIDPILLVAELERLGTGALIQRHEIDYLASCVPASGNLQEYVDRVLELATWRERLRYGERLMKAVAHRREDIFEQCLSKLAPSPQAPKPATLPKPARRLRSVDAATGEVVGESIECVNCGELQDQLDGAEKEIKAWRARYSNLQRDLERDAPKDPWYPVVAELFEIWQRLGKHPRAQFTVDRFLKALPFVRHPNYGPKVCERAIAGIMFDPFVTTMRNGKEKRHDDWDLVFRSADKLEGFANRAPLDWQPTVKAVEGQKPALKKIEGGAA